MAVSITNDALSLTLAAIHPEVSMAQQRKTAFISQARQLGKLHYFGGANSLATGSMTLSIPIEVAESTSSTILSTGFEAVDLSTQSATRAATFTFARLIRPVVISNMEKDQNAGDAGVVKIAELRYRNALGGMTREINRQILSNSSATGVESSFASPLANLGTLWGAAGSSGGSSTGFFEALAAGAQVNVVGGLDKGVYNTVPGWQNQFADAGGTFSTTGLRAMRALKTGAMLNQEASKDESVFHLCILHPTTYGLYQDAVFSQERFVDQKELDAGNLVPMFDGTKIFVDAAMQSSNIVDMGASGLKLSGYFLNLDGVTLAVHENADFELSPFYSNQSNDTTVAHISFQGGLIAKNLGSCGLLVDALA